MSRLRLIVAMAIALVLVLPATALAAAYDVGGTVTDKGGAPVAGAEVTILVQGTDLIFATTTDATGAWTLPMDVEPGAVLEVNGTGPTTSTEPDADGCITTTTTSGQLLVTIPAEGPAEPVTLPLDNELSGTVCSTTGAPAGNVDDPGLTPPATDTVSAGTSVAGNGSLLLVAGLAAFIVTMIALTATRRPRRSTVRA